MSREKHEAASTTLERVIALAFRALQKLPCDSSARLKEVLNYALKVKPSCATSPGPLNAGIPASLVEIHCHNQTAIMIENPKPTNIHGHTPREQEALPVPGSLVAQAARHDLKSDKCVHIKMICVHAPEPRPRGK